jgi:hypothetical protein
MHPIPPSGPVFHFESLLAVPVMLVGFMTLLVGYMGGWFSLRRKYPDIRERGKLLGVHKGQTGTIGWGVFLNKLLAYELYEDGFRLKMSWLSPFCRPIFVPWKDIRVERRKGKWDDKAILYFGGEGVFSKLTMDAIHADWLWADAGKFWPEKGEIPGGPSPQSVAVQMIMGWLASTIFTGIILTALFLLAARKTGPNPSPADLSIAWAGFLIPAVFFGVLFIVLYYTEVRRNEKKRNPDRD